MKFKIKHNLFDNSVQYTLLFFLNVLVWLLRMMSLWLLAFYLFDVAKLPTCITTAILLLKKCPWRRLVHYTVQPSLTRRASLATRLPYQGQWEPQGCLWHPFCDSLCSECLHTGTVKSDEAIYDESCVPSTPPPKPQFYIVIFTTHESVKTISVFQWYVYIFISILRSDGRTPGPRNVL